MIRTICFIFLVNAYFCFALKAQEDSLSKNSTLLLPSRYLITQKIVWGNNGLIRKINYFNLTEESRDRELTIRSYMITGHRILGYGSLLGMIGTGITGQKLITGDQSIKDLHEGFAGFTNAVYFSSLGFALFAPPPMKDRARGLTKLKAHKILSVIHFASMIGTNVLSGMLEDNPELRPYHRAAAISAFSSLFVATIVINL